MERKSIFIIFPLEKKNHFAYFQILCEIVNQGDIANANNTKQFAS